MRHQSILSQIYAKPESSLSMSCSQKAARRDANVDANIEEPPRARS